MKHEAMRIVVLGLSLSSSWGNGHATTYRALLKAMAARGHRILFLERDQPWYAAHRDLTRPDYCRLRFYKSISGLRRWNDDIAAADAVVVGSYVPRGIDVARLVQRSAAGVTAFYDIDTPVTLAKIDADEPEYMTRELIPGFDVYLSFTGGPTLRRIENCYGSPMARALYCSVDPQLYRRTDARRRWDLGYLGTYSADRQAKLEKLLLDPARRQPSRRFVVAGAQYPANIVWPDNVERIEHLSPSHHAEFYSGLGWTLNLTRTDMVELGYSPSVRLFEAAACATPIISDRWAGLEEIFRLGREVAIAEDQQEIVTLLARSPSSRAVMGRAARKRVFAEHTSAHRASQFEAVLYEAQARARRKQSAAEGDASRAFDGAAA